MINFKSKITQKVLSYFFLNIDSEMYLNEITRKFDVDRANLSRKLTEWEEDGILIKTKRGNLSLYKINKKYPMLSEMKKIIQKSFGIEGELKKALKLVSGINKAYIFGSYASDKLRVESDIDLLLVGSHNALIAQKEVVKIQKKFDREINVIDMTEIEFKKKRNGDLLQNIFKNKIIEII